MQRRPLPVSFRLACLLGVAALQGCGGGGVSSSSSLVPNGTSTVSAATPTAMTVSTTMASNGEGSAMAPAFTCPIASTATTFPTPAISVANVPVGTAYYVVVIDDVEQLTSNLGAGTHWLVRVNAPASLPTGNTPAVILPAGAVPVTTVSSVPQAGGLNSGTSPYTYVSNHFHPAYTAGTSTTDHYRITVYAMSPVWLLNPGGTGGQPASGPGTDFSDANLPGLNTFPTSNSNYYYAGSLSSGSAAPGFESAFAPSSTGTIYILGSGNLTTTVSGVNGPC